MMDIYFFLLIVKYCEVVTTRSMLKIFVEKFHFVNIAIFLPFSGSMLILYGYKTNMLIKDGGKEGELVTGQCNCL